MIPLWDVQISPLQTQSRISLPGDKGIWTCWTWTRASDHVWWWWCESVSQFSRSVVSNSLWPHESQHARPPCPSPTPGVYPNSCPLGRWCHLTISSSVVPFFSLLFFPTSGSSQMSQLFTSGGQNIGVSASTSVIPVNTQDWFSLGWTSWMSLQSKGLSRVFSNTTVQKHQFFCAQHETQDIARSNTFSHRFPVSACQLSTPLVSFLQVWELKVSWNWGVLLLRKWNLAYSPLPHSASQDYQPLLLKSNMSLVSYRSPQINNNNANEKIYGGGGLSLMKLSPDAPNFQMLRGVASTSHWPDILEVMSSNWWQDTYEGHSDNMISR